METKDLLAQMVEVSQGASHDALQRGFSIDQRQGGPKIQAIKSVSTKGTKLKRRQSSQERSGLSSSLADFRKPSGGGGGSQSMVGYSNPVLAFDVEAPPQAIELKS